MITRSSQLDGFLKTIRIKDDDHPSSQLDGFLKTLRIKDIDHSLDGFLRIIIIKEDDHPQRLPENDQNKRRNLHLLLLK